MGLSPIIPAGYQKEGLEECCQGTQLACIYNECSFHNEISVSFPIELYTHCSPARVVAMVIMEFVIAMNLKLSQNSHTPPIGNSKKSGE